MRKTDSGASGTIRRTAGPDVTRLVIAAAITAALLLLATLPAAAQQATPAPKPAPAAKPAAAAHDEAWLVASAVLAAPAAMREGAEVRAWDGERMLRKGTNDIICLADNAGEEGFAAACYSASLEAFMARGRELRKQGIDGAQRDEARWADVKAGRVTMPQMGMVYLLRMPVDHFDPATTDPATGYRLQSLYIPNATAASTGLPTLPGDGPWLMLAGTPSAHVMMALPPKPAAQ